jgi:hypothetical protein
MNSYIEDLKRFNVAMVVRVCKFPRKFLIIFLNYTYFFLGEANYDVARLQQEGIEVKDLFFADGQPPPQEVRIL